MDDNQNLDDVLDRHINAQAGQDAQTSQSGANFTRDDILNAVRQNKGDQNDQTIGTVEQSEDKVVASPENPVKPADDPASAEGELDQILDETSAGTVTEDGNPIGDNASESSGDDPTASGSEQPEQTSEPSDTQPEGSTDLEPVQTDIVTIDSENGEGISAQPEEPADPSAGGEPVASQGTTDSSLDVPGDQGTTGPTGSEETSQQDGSENAVQGSNQDSEQTNQESSSEVPEENSGENSQQDSGQESPGQDSEEVSTSTDMPDMDSGSDPLQMDDPIGDGTSGDLTDGTDSFGEPGDTGSTAEQDAQKTPEELEKEAQDGQAAVQAVAEVAGEPNAAPNPSAAHDAIDKGVEGEGQQKEGVEVTDAPVESGEPTSSDLPDGGTGEVLQPQIGEFDSSEKILNVEQAHEPSQSYQGFQRDAELIRKAGRVDKRLEDYARIITDKFPSTDAIPTEASQEDINFTRLSMIGLEAIIDNGRELVGQDYDPKNDDIVQEAIIQTSKHTLSNLAKVLEDLETIDTVVSPIVAKSNQLVQERDERAGQSTGNEAARISSIVGIGGHINLNNLNHAQILANISADCQAWINGPYLAFLKGIHNHEQTRLTPLILNSIQTDTKDQQIKSEDIVPEGRVIRSTDVLPGGVKIIQADDRGCLTATFLTTDVVDEEAERAVTVTVPGKFELRTLLAELASVQRLSISFKEKLSNLTESLTSFYGWYEDSDPNFSEIKLTGVEDLSSAVGFMSSFASYLVSYQKGLAAYVMLPSTTQ